MNIVKVNNQSEIKHLINKFNNRYVKPLSEEQIDKLSKKFDEYASVYKAIEDNVDLGYIAFYANNMKERVAFISQISVSKESTNKGIGKLLINKCIEECQEKNILLIQLSVYSNNKIAIDFYRKNGFFIYKQNDSEQCFFMEKKIENGGM